MGFSLGAESSKRTQIGTGFGSGSFTSCVFERLRLLSPRTHVQKHISPKPYLTPPTCALRPHNRLSTRPQFCFVEEVWAFATDVCGQRGLMLAKACGESSVTF